VLVMHDPIPIPESAKGVVRVYTNDPIQLVIDGVDDSIFERDVGGYAVITPAWYAELISTWNRHHEKE